MASSTDLFVTVNTHRVNNHELRTALVAAIVALGDVATCGAVFGEHVTVLNSVVRAEEIGIELTTRQRHVHAHFTFEIEHAEETPIHLGPRTDPEGLGVNRRLQHYFNTALGIRCYVRADLLAEQSSTKNYNRKRQAAREAEGAVVRNYADFNAFAR